MPNRTCPRDRRTTRRPFTPRELARLAADFGLTDEVRNIPGLPDWVITAGGEVFSRLRSTCHPPGSVRRLKPSSHPGGYRQVLRRVRGRKRKFFIHRLVAFVFLPPPEPGQYLVRHLDEDKTNNHKDNLRWGTEADNRRDAIRNGRIRRGEAHPGAKLNWESVNEIRRLSREGWSYAALARRFSVSKANIRLVVNCVNWKPTTLSHIPSPHSQDSLTSPGVPPDRQPPSPP